MSEQDPKNSNVSKDDTMKNIEMVEYTNDSGQTIIYITLVIIIGLFLIWIFIVIFSGDDPIRILHNMTDLTTQLAPVSDKLEQLSNIDTPPIEDYHHD